MSAESDDDIECEQTDSEAALKRWRGRLQTKTVKSRVSRPSELRPERPRTVYEAADELGLSVHTIPAWVAERRIAHLRLGRAIRIPAAEIRRVIEMSLIPAIKED